MKTIQLSPVHDDAVESDAKGACVAVKDKTDSNPCSKEERALCQVRACLKCDSWKVIKTLLRLPAPPVQRTRSPQRGRSTFTG